MESMASVRVDIVLQHIRAYADQYISALKTLLALVMTYCLAFLSPRLVRRSAIVDPILAIQVIIVIGGVMLLLWCRCSCDINATVSRCVLLSVRGIKALWREFLSLDPGEDDGGGEEWGSERVENRKVVRMTVMLVMIQQCLQPDFPTSLLLVFVVYITNCDHLKFKTTELFDLLSKTPYIGQHIPLEETSRYGERPQFQENVASPEGENSSTELTLLEKVNRHMYLILTILKISVGVLWIVILMSYSPFFMFCVHSYVTITRGWLESQLISAILALKIQGGVLEQCEGLEQYYIAAGLAFVELSLTVLFMVWVLEQGRPFIMLIALYTNIYCTGYDIFNYVITPAAYERAFLAKFQKIMGSDLRERDDLCAICLGSMGIARRTVCGHLFHGHCLRKLVSHGRHACPMCRATLV